MCASCMSSSATPATQSEGGCHKVSRRPRKTPRRPSAAWEFVKGALPPHVAVFSSPHGQPRKCWVILGDIFNGVQETCPSCFLHFLIPVMWG